MEAESIHFIDLALIGQLLELRSTFSLRCLRYDKGILSSKSSVDPFSKPLARAH